METGMKWVEILKASIDLDRNEYFETDFMNKQILILKELVS